MVLSLASFRKEVHVWLGGGARYLHLYLPLRRPQYVDYILKCSGLSQKMHSWFDYLPHFQLSAAEQPYLMNPVGPWA